MKSSKLARLFGLAILLTAMLVMVPAALAQEPTPTPDTWTPPDVVKIADDDAYVVGDEAVFTLIIANPSGDNEATWYNVTVTDVLDPIFRIDSATTTLGTVTITGQTVVVDGGITLAPGESFVVTIYCTVIGGAGEVVINRVTLEYTDEEGNPQPPGEDEVPLEIIDELPVIPEASTLLLLGSAATGLASYVGLQVRSRRRSSRE